MDNELLREYEMNDNHENMNEMTWKMKMIMKSFFRIIYLNDVDLFVKEILL